MKITGPVNGCARRARWGTVLGVLSLAAAAAPASAAVRPQNTVVAFPGSDLVVAEGAYAGQMTVKVIRQGTVIGTAAGPAQELLPGVFGLEVNHGIAGFASPGDCWDGPVAAIPDIQPGDTIEVTDGTGVDTMVVQNLTVTNGPEVVDVDQNTDTASIRIEGEAIDVAAVLNAPDPLLFGGIAVEFRHRPDGLFGDFRGEVPVTIDSVNGNVASWSALLTGFSVTQAQHVVDHADWGVTLGHTPPTSEVTIAELGAPGGAAPGCDPPVFPPPPPPVVVPPVVPVVTPVVQVVTPAPKILRALRVPAAIGQAGFLARGLQVHVRADRGAKVVRLKVWRLRSGKKPLAVGTFTRALPASGMAFVTLRKRDIGQATGTYRIEAVAGVSLATLGGTKATTFRINR